MTVFNEVTAKFAELLEEKGYDFSIAEDLLETTWPADTEEALQAAQLMDGFITMVGLGMPIRKCLAQIAVTFYRAGQLAGPDPVYEHHHDPE